MMCSSLSPPLFSFTSGIKARTITSISRACVSSASFFFFSPADEPVRTGVDRQVLFDDRHRVGRVERGGDPRFFSFFSLPLPDSTRTFWPERLVRW